MKWLKDGHMHSHYCPHGTKDTFKEYVETALEVGLNEITFTEHMPLPAIFMDEKLLKECSPNEEEILLYLKEATKIKEEYKDKIKINVGLEVDYVEGYEEKIKKMLDSYGEYLDEGILSVHFLRLDDGYHCLDMSVDDFGNIAKTLGGVDKVYDKYFENPVPENMPLLEDLYDALLAHKNPKAERIANSLVLYVHGSQNYFNHRTNVDSKNRIMCFDIRDLGNQLKELGMLIVQDAVWNRVSQNRERKIATRYYCDEFHLLLKERQTAIYSVEIWKRFRKWGGIPTGLTQNVGDFLKSEEIEGILGNSDFVYLLNQNAKDQAILADKLGLSEKQLSHVTNSEPGSGLILFDNVVIPFVDKYPTDTKTYAIMNTKPEESVKQEDVD